MGRRGYSNLYVPSNERCEAKDGKRMKSMEKKLLANDGCYRECETVFNSQRDTIERDEARKKEKITMLFSDTHEERKLEIY